MARNLAWDFEERRTDSPDRLALIHEDGRRWTFAEMDTAAGVVAERLAAVTPAQGRVGLYLSNSPELVVGLLAAWKAGLVPVPMSGLYGPEEVAGCIAKTTPAVLVADPEKPGTAGANGTGLPIVPSAVLRDALAAPAARPAVRAPQPRTDDVGLVLFTGGSTGEPKAVAITHDGSYRSMSALARGQKAGAHQADAPYPIADAAVPPNLVVLPLFHGGGIQSLLFTWHVGRTILLVARFSTDRLARLVPEYRVDNLFLLPTMVYDLVHAEDAPDLRTVRKVLVAGQRLDPGLQAGFEHRYGVIVISNYGSTEMGHVAGWNSRDVRDGRWKPGSVGRVYDGVRVEIRDADGRCLPTGEIGEIWVQTSRTVGYVGAAADGSADDLVRDGWVRSGDVGRLDRDNVLFLVGRVRELIKTGGFQVWPAEIEQALRTHPGVADVAVVGLPDERLGEVPVAFVVPAVASAPSESSVPTEDDLIDWCRARLAHFKAIRGVRFVDALPRSEAGKVQRAALLDLDRSATGDRPAATDQLRAEGAETAGTPR